MAKNRIFSGIAKKVRGIFDLSSDGSSIVSMLGGNNLDFGVNVNKDSALKFTAVFAAVKILSENIASLPKQVLKYTANGYVEDKKHPASRILASRPNEYTDRFSFWFSMLASVLGQGEAFAVIKFNGTKVDSLHMVPKNCVEVSLVDGKKVYVVSKLVNGLEFLNGVYEDWEMIHIMYFSLDGIHGIDPITYNAAAIGRGIATQKFSAEYYRKGGNIKAVLETEGELGDDDYDNFMRHFKQYGDFETPLLEYGIKYKPIGISPVAAQLIQSETMSIQDIARIYSVPPHLLAELSHATFSNIEQQNIYFAVYSLRPLCKRIEEQLEQKLFLEKEKGIYSVKFDLKGMMRGDDAARASYYEKGINSGWMTPNEARSYEGLPSKAGLDNPRLPLNTALISEDGAVLNPNDNSKE